jgi:transposase-like protein
MDRATLAGYINSGLSLEAIGLRVGRHPSTVGYWIQKHGLRAANHDKHAARGGIERAELEAMVDDGASIAEIAQSLGVSKSMVRHWLSKYGLRTRGSAGRRSRAALATAKKAGRKVVRHACDRHGEADFVLEGRGYYRCRVCRQEAVVRRRRKVKAILIAEAGGRCALCGYDRNPAALQFHHLDPARKSFGIASGGMARSIHKMRDESRKCILLCSNCHAEVETAA